MLFTLLDTSTITDAESANTLVPNIACPIITAWAVLGPVLKLIIAFIVGAAIMVIRH
jgi:hypothetical protein